MGKKKDINQLAKNILDIATGEIERKVIKEAPQSKGGKMGGKARAEKLTAKERSEIAKKAAKARWNKEDSSE